MRARRVAAVVAVLVLGAVGAACTPGPAAGTTPQVLGTPRVGEVLTATNGSWSNSPTSFTYRWERCLGLLSVNCITTVGTGPSYTVQAADVGLYLRVIVFASNAVGPSNGFQAATPVGPVEPALAVGPTAVASISPLTVPAFQTVTFDGSASVAGDAPIVSWSWDFAGASTDTGAIVTRQFPSGGTFPITLTVLDANGLSDSVTVDLTVLTPV